MSVFANGFYQYLREIPSGSKIFFVFGEFLGGSAITA